jgi:site-specific DNA recombinase
MQRLINCIKDKTIDYVIVYKLDRLSRSQKDTLYLIEDVFNPHGVDFISMQETMDTSTPMGRAMLGIMSTFAQLERETIRERTRMGMKERIKNGLWRGGANPPFGYDYDKSTGTLIQNKDAETVKKIYNLYLQGYSCGKIAEMVGIKYESYIRLILKKKTNAGYIIYNNEEYIGKHKPIVSLKTYLKAMDMMSDRSINRITTSHYLLTGLLYCGKCGAKMRYQKWGKCGNKIYCYSQAKSKKYLVKDPNCNNAKVWADEVEDLVIKDLFQFSKKQEDKTNNISYNALDVLNDQYNLISNKIKRLYNLYAEDPNDFLLETIESNKKDIQKIVEQIKKEQERNVLAKKENKLREDIKNLSEIWNDMTPQEQQNIAHEMIKKITITDNKIDIEYNF